MTQWKIRSRRGPTGKVLQKNRKKRRFEAGRDFAPVMMGKSKLKKMRMLGGKLKNVLLSVDMANVISGGKNVKTKILTVKDNPADPQFARRNTITKGAIIETEAGMARVTSRPGQDGTVNAVLIEKK